MLDEAKLGQLQQYFAGIRRLHELFPNDWATVSLLDEEMRSELWPRLHEEISQGVKPEPKGYDRARPWGSIIAESRYDYLQGPMADHWRRKEIMLERASKIKPANKNLGEAPGSSAAPPHRAIKLLSDKWYLAGDLVDSQDSQDQDFRRQPPKRHAKQQRKLRRPQQLLIPRQPTIGTRVGTTRARARARRGRRSCPLTFQAVIIVRGRTT